MFPRGSAADGYGHGRGGFKRQRTHSDSELPRYAAVDNNNNNTNLNNYNGFYGNYGSDGRGLPYFGWQPRGFPAVRLRGIPFNCRENDLVDFFAGLDVVDALLVRRQGRLSGEAFVVFATPPQVEFALQRHRQNIGRRYIEVFRCSKQDYYRAVASEVNASADSRPSAGTDNDNKNNKSNNKNDNDNNSSKEANPEDASAANSNSEAS